MMHACRRYKESVWYRIRRLSIATRNRQELSKTKNTTEILRTEQNNGRIEKGKYINNKNTLIALIYTECIKMTGAVWKLIIFTSMVKRLINTSGNERVTLQVYDTCLQMFLFFRLRRKYCLTRSTLSSDTFGFPALFPLQTHPVAWNCWY
jgi:hypothetical protein